MTTLRSLAGYLLVLYGVSLTLSGCGRDESASEAEAATEHDAPALGVALDEEEARKLGVEVAHIAAGAYQPFASVSAFSSYASCAIAACASMTRAVPEANG